jgi:hypothetical protein
MRSMSCLFGAVFLCASFTAHTVAAQDGAQTLGIAAFFTNDGIGDGLGRWPSKDKNDRWRSAGVGVSVFRGDGWSGALPTQPFDIVEYRFRAEVLAPDNLVNPPASDRLYAGSWYIGAHTHLDWRGYELTAGADLVVTGEQSGIRRFHRSIYKALSMSQVNVADHQIDDGIYFHGTVELANPVVLDGGELRPFIEVQGGVETLVRAGFDLTVGGLGQGGLRAREPVTGQRIAAISGHGDDGWSFLFGADLAYVERSIFLPDNRGYNLENARHRIRAGVNYGFGSSNLFYGLTYMSKEFAAQSEGQLVGGLSVMRRF